MLRAVAHMMEPMLKSATEEIRSTGRPNMSEILAMNGIETDVESRYAVPTQKPWVAVALRSSTMACCGRNRLAMLSGLLHEAGVIGVQVHSH